MHVTELDTSAHVHHPDSPCHVHRVESAFICLDPSLISTLGSANVASFIAVFSDDLRRKFPGPV